MLRIGIVRQPVIQAAGNRSNAELAVMISRNFESISMFRLFNRGRRAN
jgi:hypothetical protein